MLHVTMTVEPATAVGPTAQHEVTAPASVPLSDVETVPLQEAAAQFPQSTEEAEPSPTPEETPAYTPELSDEVVAPAPEQT